MGQGQRPRQDCILLQRHDGMFICLFVLMDWVYYKSAVLIGVA